MWGNIILEVSFMTNFHLGFNNTRSDVVIHLVHWQYWWWFWFSYLWGLYFLLFMRIFRFRTLKFKPRIATTYRPHGKWGDVIICLLPVSWCVNIITNSNLILRMIEWQAESSLFTLRIRGRQWYWIYKYDLKTVTDLLAAPKNVGHNKWQISTPNDLEISDDYLHILQLRMNNKWLKKYWTEKLDKDFKENNFNLISNVEVKKFKLANIISETKHVNINVLNDKNFSFFDKRNFNSTISDDNFKYFENTTYFNANRNLFKKNFSNEKFTNIFNFFKKENENKFLINHEDTLEVTRWLKRTQGTNSPLRIIKYPLTKNSFELQKQELFRVRINEKHNSLIQKPISNNNYLVLKQKKYKPYKVLPTRVKKMKFDNTESIKYSRKLTLLNNSIFVENNFNGTTRYKLLKKMKQQHENIPVTLWKRLLRTKRTLVLPAHVNIALITNSYDVIHSWFIPGLGLKLDCVPGRATHHVLHIDNVGFYYGQCAEICGRYHHHMPIRVCALPFEHFLVWWHTYGLPKILGIKSTKKLYTKDHALRKYTW